MFSPSNLLLEFQIKRAKLIHQYLFCVPLSCCPPCRLGRENLETAGVPKIKVYSFVSHNKSKLARRNLRGKEIDIF